MKQINSKEYKEIITDNQKKIIIFSAPWCGPCRMFKPVLEKISEDLQIPLYGVNIDEESDLAAELNIRSVPTTFIYNSEIITIIGVKPEADIRAALA